MFLNRLAALALSLVIGAFLAVMAAVAAITAIARANSLQPTQIARFSIEAPISIWPIELTLSFFAAPSIGLLTTTVVFMMIKNVSFSVGPRSVDSFASSINILKKSAPNDKGIFAGRYAGHQVLTASFEDRGLVVGPPGTGKTAFLVNQILQAALHKLSFAAIDLKPELHTILATALKKNGYRVVRINPAIDDELGDHWNPLDDIKDPTEMAELCAALLPIREPRDAPFVESQRDWLKAAVFHLATEPGGSLPSAFEFLSSSADPTSLLKTLESSASVDAQRIGRRLKAGLAGQKPDPLILSGLTGALRTLDFLSLPGVRSALGHSDFSIADLGKSGKPIALFLQFEEAKLQALGPVLSFFATGLLQGLIKTAGVRAPVAIFLDELGNMPPIPGLAEKLNTIRSRMMPTWMYFQTMEQINRRYGQQADSVFIAASDVQVFFRLNDQNTRELVSKLVGTTYRAKHSRSISERGGTSSVTHERVAVIEPHELGQLKLGQVLTLYRGAAALGVATPYFVDFPNFRKR